MAEEERLVEAMAVAISGAPFPSMKSLAKARAALAAAHEAGWLIIRKPEFSEELLASLRGNYLDAYEGEGD